MQNITPEMWKLLFVGFVVGILFTYIFVRFVSGSAKQQAQKDKEIKKMQKALELQQSNLEKYFSENAELMHSLAEDYQKLHNNFLQQQEILLPRNKENIAADLVEKETESSDIAPKNKETKENMPPKDYSEGSSGLLKD